LTGTTNTSVNWSVNGTQGGSATVGTISTAGLYKAPSSVPSGGSVTVTATSAADTTKSASAKITIDASTAAVTVSVSPTSASVTAGKTKQFTASVSGTTSTGVTWQVNSVTSGNSTVGTVSTSGLYTAPSSVPSGGSVTVTAVSSYETTASAKATVAVTAAATPPPSGSTWSGWNFTPTLYASPTGSGSTCSSSSPCTIDYAFNTKATAGSVIQAAAGTYASGSSHLTLSKSGTSGKPIVLTCVTRGACHITGTSTGNTDVMGIAGNYITFDGFDVSNVSSSIPNSNMIIYLTGSHDILSRNAIHDVQPDCGSNGGGAVQTGGSTSYNTYDANLVYNVGNNNPACKSGSVVQVDGILDETNGVGDVVENNIIYNIYGGWGITHGYPDGAAAAITIVNNLVFEVGDGGIALTYGAASSIIKNNMMIDNGFNYSGGCGLYGYSTASGMQISNNDADGNSGGAYCQSDATGTIATSGGDLSAAPASTFVNWQTNGSGNYQESASSPTIGAGTSASAPDHDFAGNTRSGSTDIGPYQHTN